MPAQNHVAKLHRMWRLQMQLLRVVNNRAVSVADIAVVVEPVPDVVRAQLLFVHSPCMSQLPAVAHEDVRSATHLRTVSQYNLRKTRP